MDNKNTDFPQYRMLFNHKSYFKIIDDRNFEELQQVGTKWFKYAIKAEQYFEILRIQDMLAKESAIYLTLQEKDYQLIASQI